MARNNGDRGNRQMFFENWKSVMMTNQFDLTICNNPHIMQFIIACMHSKCTCACIAMLGGAQTSAQHRLAQHVLHGFRKQAASCLACCLRKQAPRCLARCFRRQAAPCLVHCFRRQAAPCLAHCLQNSAASVFETAQPLF